MTDPTPDPTPDPTTVVDLLRLFDIEGTVPDLMEEAADLIETQAARIELLEARIDAMQYAMQLETARDDDPPGFD